MHSITSSVAVNTCDLSKDSGQDHALRKLNSYGRYSEQIEEGRLMVLILSVYFN